MNTAGKLNLLIKEKDKFDPKTGMGSALVQEVVNYFIAVGRSQLMDKQEKFRKLNNLAEGVIDIEDYLDEEIPEELEFDLKDSRLEDIGLSFYPLIPNAINVVLGENDKKYSEFYVRAINPENSNNVLESLNNELRQLLVTKAQEAFLAQNPNADEEQQKLFMESKKIQGYYTKDYRTEIEKWANHIVRVDDRKHDIKSLERKVLKEIMVTEHPAVTIECHDGDYYPKVLNPAKCFYIKDPESECYSESMMFGYEEESTITTLINELSEDLSADSLESVNSWLNTYAAQGFVVNGQAGAITGNRLQDFESTQNYLQFRDMDRGRAYVTGSAYQHSGYLHHGASRSPYDSNHMVKKTTVYFNLPQKVGKYTYKKGDVMFSDLVDDSFKVTFKPKYRKDSKIKTVETLVEGEHVDWFYVNQLWRAKKISLNVSGYTYGSTGNSNHEIWVELDKYKIQYSDGKSRYGTSMPVYGGPVTNKYNQSKSFTEMGAPWQIYYNWIWNRNQQLITTEVGKFLLFNQATIPTESMGESWGNNNLLKFMMTARDVGIAPLDTSLSNLGQSAMQIHGGVGQVVDLNKTSDVLEKIQIAQSIKNEFYNQVGLSQDYMFGKVEPRMSATLVAQGAQRSSVLIQHLFTRLDVIMKRLRMGMIETAQYIASESPESSINYMNSDGMRVIFNINTEGFLLNTFQIYGESNVADANILQQIHSYAANQAAGTPLEDIASVLSSKSIPETINKLKALTQERMEQQAKQQQAQQQAQQQQMQAMQELEDKKIQAEAIENDKDRAKDILVAQIKAVGDSNDDANTIQQEILELQSENQRQKEYYDKLNYDRAMFEQKAGIDQRNADRDGIRDELEEKVKLKQLEQKDRELEIREKDIIARNKRTKVLD